MKSSYKYILGTILGLTLAVGLIIASQKVPIAKAALGLGFDSTNKNLPSTNKFSGNQFATTSATYFYMTAGTATTTLALYTANVDVAALNVIFNASSTSSVLNWRYEFSTNGIDWYSDDFNLNQSIATSTLAIPTFTSYSWTFASSTGGSSNNTTAFKRVELNEILSPYTRIVFYLAPGSTGGAINVQAVLKTNNSI